jgi:hypothetical protein
MEENRFVDVLVLVRHLVAADSKDFADSFDGQIVTVAGKIVQFREYIPLPREKRKVIQNPNWFFPTILEFSRDNGVISLPRSTFIQSKIWIVCERGYVCCYIVNRLGGRFD